MQYYRTLNVWNWTIRNAIETGKLKLQVGQWLTCGENNDKKARFVGVSKSGVLQVVHWQGTASETNKKFKQAIKNWSK